MPAPASSIQFASPIGDVDFSLSGEWFAASSGPQLWLLPTSSLPALTVPPASSLPALNGDITQVAFSPDSTLVGVTTNKGQVVVYNVVKRQARTLFQTTLGPPIAFTPDSAHLVAVTQNGGVELWNLASSRKTADLAAEGSGATAVAAGPAYLALGMTGKIQIMDQDGNLITEIEAPGDQSLLAFSPDGSLFAASNSAGLVKVWQVQGQTFQEVGEVRKDFVSSLAFSAAGDILAIGARGTVFMLDPLTLTEKSRVLAAGDVKGLSFSSDGSFIATASQRAVQFWQVDAIPVIASQDLVIAACARLTTNLSQAQWNSLFGGEEYRLLCENLPLP
jgi:WD40 repeat protein